MLSLATTLSPEECRESFCLEVPLSLYCTLRLTSHQLCIDYTSIRRELDREPISPAKSLSVMSQVVEAGLGHLPFSEKSVTTPTGRVYVGVDFAKKLCGVSMIRSGESMENALRACCKGIKIGKILIHR